MRKIFYGAAAAAVLLLSGCALFDRGTGDDDTLCPGGADCP